MLLKESLAKIQNRKYFAGRYFVQKFIKMSKGITTRIDVFIEFDVIMTQSILFS